MDCGTWEQRNIHTECFGEFDLRELAIVLTPIMIAVSAIFAVRFTAQLLVRPKPAVVGDSVEIRRVGPLDARTFARSFDAEAAVANGVDPTRHRWLIRGVTLLLPSPTSLAVVERSTGRIGGGVSVAVDTTSRPFGAELGIWVSTGFRNRGFASEAISLVADLLHRNGMAPISIETATTNVEMRRALNRTEFVATSENERTLPDGTTVTAIRCEWTPQLGSESPPTGYVAFEPLPTEFRPSRGSASPVVNR